MCKVNRVSRSETGLKHGFEDRGVQGVSDIFPIFELIFFVKKFLVVGASGMLWTGQWISQSVSE